MYPPPFVKDAVLFRSLQCTIIIDNPSSMLFVNSFVDIDADINLWMK